MLCIAKGFFRTQHRNLRRIGTGRQRHTANGNRRRNRTGLNLDNHIPHNTEQPLRRCTHLHVTAISKQNAKLVAGCPADNIRAA